MTISGNGGRMKIMRSLTKNVVGWLTFMLVGVNGLAQSVANSAYNVFGLGTLEQTGLVAFEGMGYASIGARPSDMVNLKNPAALNSIRGRGFTQIFDVGITYSHLFQKSIKETASGSFGRLHDLNYWFRNSPKSAWSVGLSKFSDATYNIIDTQSNDNANSTSDVQHTGNGGSSQVYLAGAFSMLPNTSLGVKTGFLFGSFQSEELLSLTLPGSSLIIENDRSFLEPFIEGGLQYGLTIKENFHVVLGGVFRPGATANMNEGRLIIGNTGTATDSLNSEGSSTFYIPRKVGAGIGVQLKSWDLNFDYEFENWGRNDEQERFAYRDRFVTSFGAQYIKDRTSDKLIGRTAFRVGAGVHSNYISVDDENYMSQYYSVGLGIPARRGTAAVNVSYQYYRSGTDQPGLIRESTNTISLSVTFKDIWFRKRAFY